MANIFKKNQDISVEGDVIGIPQGKIAKNKKGAGLDNGKKSKFVIALYVLTGILTVYGAYMVYYTINYIIDYYASYGTAVSDDLANVIQYIITNSIIYFVYALLLFTGARILKRVIDLQKSVKFQEIPSPTSGEDA